jgi:hypothetical protein
MKWKTKKFRGASQADKILDQIKDEIDCLHEIKNRKRRLDAARDLIEYIQLHHVDYQ